MTRAERLSFVVPADDLAAAVAFYTAVLGVEPTFVDGERWAQFDLDGGRLSLAGADRADDRPGVMVKVATLETARERLEGAGYQVGAIEQGAHEGRCTVRGPDGWPVVLYAPS